MVSLVYEHLKIIDHFKIIVNLALSISFGPYLFFIQMTIHIKKKLSIFTQLLFCV